MGCSPAAALRVGYFLSELSVDHLFKADALPLLRKPIDVATLFLDVQPERDAPLYELLAGYPMARFDKLDASTGTFELRLDGQPRVITVRSSTEGPPGEVTVKLPERLTGGYWRTPGVLEMVFWEANRATVVTSRGGSEREMVVECVSVSPHALRIVTAGADVPDLIFQYAPCP